LAGSHTLVFRGREAGAILDKIIITSDRTFQPGGDPPIDAGADAAVDATADATADASTVDAASDAPAGPVINAASCSAADVQAAIDAAPAGAVVSVPAGSCTWSTLVQLGSKPLTLRGAGVGVTNITHNAPGSMVHLISFSEDASRTTRITGFTFLGGSYDHRFMSCAGTYHSAPCRFDHNDVHANSTAIMMDLWSCKGLVDNNTFSAPDNSEMIHNFGDTSDPYCTDPSACSHGWLDDVHPGSLDALYVEDNTFNNTTVGGWGAQSALQSYNAAHTVIRYNTFHDSQVDAHGTATMVGARWWEIYENTFAITQTTYYQDKYMDLRAGSGVAFNNHHTGAPSNAAIVVREEDSGYPALYQIGRGINQNLSPVYFWGNDASIPYRSYTANGRYRTGVTRRTSFRGGTTLFRRRNLPR
jgi:hypothetical protein